MYDDSKVPKIDIINVVFALNSTTVSLSLNLFSWAPGKYSREAVKTHTLLELRGSIPSFILNTDGKYHDSNIFDVIMPSAIYVMDKAYIDFKALYRMNELGAFFISRAKSTIDCSVIKENFNIDESRDPRSDKLIIINGYKPKWLYPETLRLVDFYDGEKDTDLTFMTNNIDVTALEVANLYRNK